MLESQGTTRGAPREIHGHLEKVPAGPAVSQAATRKRTRRPHSAFGNEHPRTPLEVYREPIRFAFNQ